MLTGQGRLFKDFKTNFLTNEKQLILSLPIEDLRKKNDFKIIHLVYIYTGIYIYVYAYKSYTYASTFMHIILYMYLKGLNSK